MIGLADILAILATLVAALAVGAFILLRRELRRVHQSLLDQAESLVALQRSMKVVAGEAFQRAQDQATIERALEQLVNQQHELSLEIRLHHADQGAYAQAIKLIQGGQSREQVRALCALNETELDLLFGLHGQGIGPGLGSRAPS